MADLDIAALRKLHAEAVSNKGGDFEIDTDEAFRIAFMEHAPTLLDAAEQLQAVTAERDRLNEDLFIYRREERKILGLPDEATAVDHLDAIQSIKNLRDGWEIECEQQNSAKERIITERDSLRTQRDALLAALRLGLMQSDLPKHVADLRAKLAKAEAEIVRLSGRTGYCAECVDLTKRLAEAEKERDALTVVRDSMATANDRLRHKNSDLTRERDAALSAQNARAVEVADNAGKTLQSMFDGFVFVSSSAETGARHITEQMMRYLDEVVASLRAEQPKPADPIHEFHVAAHGGGKTLKNQAQAETAPERHHTANVCGIRRKSDGYWWQCDSEHGAGWNDKRIRQAWTMRAAYEHIADMRNKGMLMNDDVEVVELVPAETAKPSEGDEVWRTAEARAADVKDNATRTALRAVIDLVVQRRALGEVRP